MLELYFGRGVMCVDEIFLMVDSVFFLLLFFACLVVFLIRLLPVCVWGLVGEG